MKLNKFISYINSKGWGYSLTTSNNKQLPDHIIKRYPGIPEDFILFQKKFDELYTPDECTWFLFTNEYNNKENQFSWNEPEKVSLEAAEGDDEWKQEIIEFWDRYLPIVLSVRNEYSYYAIDTKNGKIVSGTEPEFEEIEEIAGSFSEFLELITENKINI